MLTGNYFIDALSQRTEQKLVPRLEPVRLRKGRSLYLQEQSVDQIYFPVGAVISEYRVTEDGNLAEVLVTGKEGAVGLAALNDSGEAANSCAVLIGGLAWKIPPLSLASVLEAEPEIASDLMRLLDLQSKRLARKMICDRYHSVEQRLCTWLLGLADRTGRTQFNISHSEAARALGVYRATITEALHSLRDRGAMKLARMSVAILDLPAAEAIACECRLSFPVQPKEKLPASQRRYAA
ncbi:MAG: Crp/Fnr family transcriptional regulator [Pyrinomonadaceae bacterium]